MKSICSVLFIVAAAFAARDKEPTEQGRELLFLREQLLVAQDSLEEEIAARWYRKKQFAKQRELDKERLGELQKKQERLYNEFARVKEQNLAHESTLELERKELATRRDEREFLRSRLSDVCEKEAERVFEFMPLDHEERRTRLEDVRTVMATRGSPTQTLDALVSFYGEFLRKGLRIRLVRREVLPSRGGIQDLNVARFGNVFAYGMNQEGHLYIVRQTGRLGADRFAVDTIGAPELRTFLHEAFPAWSKNAGVTGLVLADVLQNAQSGMLIGGQEITVWARLREYLRQGGILMAPLAIILLWAIGIVIVKLAVLQSKSTYNRQLYNVVKQHLEKGEVDQAYTYANKHKGVVGKIVKVCLEHSKWSKKSAEKAVREILVEETPVLERNLSTLAVLAGAAPLLGLLGTVTGMIRVFNVITQYGTGDPKLLAGGISEALVTTQVGLIVAIPIMLVHDYLSGRSDHIQGDMQKHAVRILNRLWPTE